ncbi:MAG: YaiI/YqxD family protein [Eubacteriales bacterium]
MTIFIDADACPVVRETEEAARKYNIKVVLLCDTNHVYHSAYSEVIVISAGADAVDFALVNRCKAGDIAVTQDYGVAVMALSRKAYAIHQSGMLYTEDNIGGLLSERHMSKEARRSSSKNHMRGPRKRTEEDNRRFAESLDKLIADIIRNSTSSSIT